MRIVSPFLPQMYGWLWFMIKETVIGGFYKLDEISNDANTGIRGFTTWKQKNPVTKCYP